MTLNGVIKINNTMISPVSYSVLFNTAELNDDYFMDTMFCEPNVRNEKSLRMKGDFRLYAPTNMAFVDDFYSRHKDYGDGKTHRILMRIVEKRTAQSRFRRRKSDSNYERYQQKRIVSREFREVTF